MSESAFVTFVIPTKGRSTLGRAIGSVMDQTQRNGAWSLVVVGDKVPGLEDTFLHPRVHFVNLPFKLGRENMGGRVRNVGMEMAVSDWLAFVDDDDVVDPHYVEWLKEEQEGADLVMFRMKHAPSMLNGVILPDKRGLVLGGFGISFALRREFVERSGVRFRNSHCEDYEMVESCKIKGARIKQSSRIAYYVRPEVWNVG